MQKTKPNDVYILPGVKVASKEVLDKLTSFDEDCDIDKCTLKYWHVLSKILQYFKAKTTKPMAIVRAAKLSKAIGVSTYVCYAALVEYYENSYGAFNRVELTKTMHLYCINIAAIRELNYPYNVNGRIEIPKDLHISSCNKHKHANIIKAIRSGCTTKKEILSKVGYIPDTTFHKILDGMNENHLKYFGVEMVFYRNPMTLSLSDELNHISDAALAELLCRIEDINFKYQTYDEVIKECNDGNTSNPIAMPQQSVKINLACYDRWPTFVEIIDLITKTKPTDKHGMNYFTFNLRSLEWLVWPNLLSKNTVIRTLNHIADNSSGLLQVSTPNRTARRFYRIDLAAYDKARIPDIPIKVDMVKRPIYIVSDKYESIIRAFRDGKLTVYDVKDATEEQYSIRHLGTIIRTMSENYHKLYGSPMLIGKCGSGNTYAISSELDCLTDVELAYMLTTDESKIKHYEMVPKTPSSITMKEKRVAPKDTFKSINSSKYRFYSRKFKYLTKNRYNLILKFALSDDNDGSDEELYALLQKDMSKEESIRVIEDLTNLATLNRHCDPSDGIQMYFLKYDFTETYLSAYGLMPKPFDKAPNKKCRIIEDRRLMSVLKSALYKVSDVIDDNTYVTLDDLKHLFLERDDVMSLCNRLDTPVCSLIDLIVRLGQYHPHLVQIMEGTETMVRINSKLMAHQMQVDGYREHVQHINLLDMHKRMRNNSERKEVYKLDSILHDDLHDVKSESKSEELNSDHVIDKEPPSVKLEPIAMKTTSPNEAIAWLTERGFSVNSQIIDGKLKLIVDL